MNETRNTESQISTRGLDSEMEKKMELTKVEIQEAIDNLNAEYEVMQEEAKALCGVLKELYDNGVCHTSDEYQVEFMKLNRLSDAREVNQMRVQRLEENLKALV